MMHSETKAPVEVVPHSVLAADLPTDIDYATFNSDARFTAVPLTVDQHCLLNLDLLEPDRIFNSLLFDALQPLNADCLRRAVAWLQARHHVLRSRFVKHAGRWHQFIDNATSQVPFHVVHLPASAETSPDAALVALSRQVQGSLRLASGPLYRVVLVEHGSGHPQRLYVLVHHLISDGFSTFVLLDELRCAYTACVAGNEPDLPSPGVSFADWAAGVHACADNAALNDADYWRRVPWQDLPHLHIDYPQRLPENTLASHQRYDFCLNPQETGTFMYRLPRRFGMTATELMAAALLLVFSDWLRSRWLSIFVHDAGRDIEGCRTDADLSCTIGWLSFQRLLVLQRGNGELTEQLQSLAEQINAIPNRGLGFKLIRHCSSNQALMEQFSAWPEPELWLNYVGPMRAALDSDLLCRSPLANTVAPYWMHPDNRQKWLLSYVASIDNEQLQFSLFASDRLYKTQTLEMLNARLAEMLRRMIALEA